MRAGLTLLALNRGVVSRLGLARSDVRRLALAAQTQTNWMPRVLGSMMLRAGLKYIGGIYTNAAARFLKFIFSTTDTALLELTSGIMRVWINDAVLTRPSVATAVTNGNFNTDIVGWTDLDEAGATSAWQTGGYMALTGTGTARAIREQQVTVAVGDRTVEHGLRIVINRGPVTLRVGSTSGGDEYVSETILQPGTHSLSFTPTGDFYVRFQSDVTYTALVDSCNVEAAGAVTLPTPWLAADLSNVRTDQSGDVIFVACAGHQQRRIERRGTRPNARSWSVVVYRAVDGPFDVLNTTPTTLTASAITGAITLTASRDLFRSTHVGGLFSLESQGQVVTRSSATSGEATSSIRVAGVGNDRVFSIVISGNNTASTVDLQRSYDNATWSNVGGALSWTTNTSTVYNDALDNQIVFYRLILTTRVAPDTVTMELRIGSGSVRGIVEITQVTNSTTAIAIVLSDLGGTTATADWQEGKWSALRGWPTSVRIHDGRLWWAGINGVWGSVSDAYDSFDETVDGNAGPINRTIGSGPVDTVNWLLSLKGLSIGAQGTEYVARANSLDDPLTPTNFNVKAASTQGSGAVDALKVDQRAYFVNRSSVKVFEIAFSLQEYDYDSTGLMELAPEIGQPGIVRMDAQRQPDTRVHCVRSDGTVVVAVINRVEEVLAWVPVTTDGVIEDVVTLPAANGDLDDQVYYVVRRTIGGATVRYLEKFAQEEDCLGDLQHCYLADSFRHYSGAATQTITGLSHLEGKQVVVWADGQDVGTIDTARPWTQRYTVSGGQITLQTAASSVVVGLGYTAQFKSAKLGLAAPGIVPIGRHKTIPKIGLVAANLHPKGLKFGPTLDDTGSRRMDDLPAMESGTGVGTAVRTDYDQELIPFPGTWTADSRVCLQAQAPRPATVMAIAIDMEQN